MRAAIAVALLTASAGSAGHTIDLARGTFDGHRVLGLTVPQVAAALGRPDFRVGDRIGWGTPAAFTREVLLTRSAGELRAQALVLESGTVIDAKAGNLLLQKPAALQEKVEARYGTTFNLARRLACTRSLCTGEFIAKQGSLHVTFGSTKARGTFVSVWKPLR